MVEEYISIMKNHVWDIEPGSAQKSMVSSKWIFKIKHVVDGSIEKFKVRFVARGFSQRKGVDYEETFSQSSDMLPFELIYLLPQSLGEDSPDKCEDSIPQQDHLGESIHRTTSGL
jgi:hypothetical protein